MKKTLGADATALNPPTRRPRRSNPKAAGKRVIKGRGWVA